jgi:hypothetical protein
MNRFGIVLFLFFINAYATTSQEIIKIAEAEAKSAASKIHFKENPNTSNYDITYHKLEFSVDPAVADIAGKVTTTFTALENLATITFDLDDVLVVSSVTQNGNSLSFSQNSADELVITLQNTLTQ